MNRPLRSLGLVAAVVCSLFGCASNEYEAPAPAAPVAMTPEQQQAWQDYADSQAPGEHHRALEPLVGHFEAQITEWMEPSATPTVSSGVLENTWVLGGRFVLSQYRGEAAGAPFEGMGLIGYDNLKQKYVGNWADSLATNLWPTATGDFSDSDDALTLSRVMTDPMTGDLIKIRDVTTIVDHDHITYEMFLTRPGADEFKMLEAHYIRA